ncbi:hypothetical protein C1645_828574 [Glomus cerebriforme]|uniref:P-loop containing nucleoside triphosphate hydrolase protein n=1 Tax=Glomus cerebriforme TaxID=658196 RepID=A0A397SSG0_9GLOM|nr:hypothetical protein C1645_828574 [Glomus cerebriforme]
MLDQSSYHLVCGEYGTGKSTLTKIASNEVEHGVIYVDIPVNLDKFGDEFGEALNFTFKEQISYTRQLIKKMHDAKRNADDRKYIAVLLLMERVYFKECSCLVSADSPVIEIGDLSEEESMDYLTNKCRINESETKKLYELVGGRIVDLISIAKNLLNDSPSKQILFGVEDKFQVFSIMKLEGASSVLYWNQKSLHERFFNNTEEANEVLKSNVFAYHPGNNTVTFQSRAVECYVQENESNESNEGFILNERVLNQEII